MPRPKKDNPERGEAKARLLAAARDLIRRKGFAATSVEDLCRSAAVTKGAFFHHFESKEALGVAAADSWAETTAALFNAAPYHETIEPLGHILGYLDYRRSLVVGDAPEFTCLVGTIVQETYTSSNAIRMACRAAIFEHAATLEPYISAAMKERGIEGDWSARSLAIHIQAVLQGAFVVAKADGGRGVALSSIDHLKRYIELLFQGSLLRNAEDDPSTRRRELARRR